MRRLSVLCAVLLLLSITSLSLAESPQMVFGIKPGMLVQSSYFGLAFERFQPFIGVDWVGVSVNSEGYDASASVIIPHIGTKLFLKPYGVDQQVAPYFVGDWFFSLASVSVDGLESEEEDLIKEVLEFWGLGFGFGAEYFFTKSFSVGGEYGFRYLHDSAEYSYSEGGYYGEPAETVNEEFSFAFKVTYAVISANYRF